MSTSSEYDFAMHDYRVRAHYKHAIEKHPYFCDKIIANTSKTDIDTYLELCRAVLAARERQGEVEAFDVIECEFYEAMQAYAHGDIAHAVEECYDVIATLLRMVDVLEGRQKLGKPETDGEIR